MDDHRARARIGPERGRDRRHARGEDETGIGLIPDSQSILEHFEVGIVDPAIDQSGLFIRALLAQAVGELEELFSVLRRSKDESRGLENRRLESARTEKGHNHSPSLGFPVTVRDFQEIYCDCLSWASLRFAFQKVRYQIPL